jgi:hypothetical protein
MFGMGLSRNTRESARIEYGSVEITTERAIYTDAASVRWRLYDFARSGGEIVSVRPGAISASIRIFVRQDCRERRRALFSPRDDTLTPQFNHNTLATAAMRRQGKWVDTWAEKFSGEGARR